MTLDVEITDIKTLTLTPTLTLILTLDEEIVVVKRAGGAADLWLKEPLPINIDTVD